MTDDYYIDNYFWKDAIDFLDVHDDYTIYATNIKCLYNDGLTELKYDYQDLISKTSTYLFFGCSSDRRAGGKVSKRGC